MSFQFKVRRNTEPDIVHIVTDRDGEPIGNIAGFAFRLNAIQDRPDLPDSKFEVLSISTSGGEIAITDAANSEITISPGRSGTGLTTAIYPAEITWRADGTDPSPSHIHADDFEEGTYEIADRRQT